MLVDPPPIKSSFKIVPMLVTFARNGIKTQTEDMQIACIPTTKSKPIIFIDVPEDKHDETSAESLIDFSQINARCPPAKNSRIAVHTHIDTQSLLTPQDMVTAESLRNYQVNGMCAIGINGYEWTVYDQGQWLYSHKKWNSKQFQQILGGFPTFPLFKNIACYFAQKNDFNCFGEQLGDKEAIPLGNFAGLSFINEDVEMEHSNEMSYVLANSSRTQTIQCHSIPFRFGANQNGNKLVCYDQKKVL